LEPGICIVFRSFKEHCIIRVLLIFISNRYKQKVELKRGDSSGVCDMHREYTYVISMEISERKKQCRGPTYRYSGDGNVGLKQTGRN